MTESLPEEVSQTHESYRKEGTEPSPELRALVESCEEQMGNAVADSNSVMQRIDAALQHPHTFPSPARSTRGQLIAIRGRVEKLRDKFVEGLFVSSRLLLLKRDTLGDSDVQFNSRKQTSRFQDKERAKLELREEGITQDQKEAYKPLVSELLARGIIPYEYDLSSKVASFIPNLIHGKTIHNGVDLNDERTLGDERIVDAGREDAWRLYLGLPQRFDTFDVSNYRPAKGIEDIYYYKINGFFEKWAMQARVPLQRLIESLFRTGLGYPGTSADEAMGYGALMPTGLGVLDDCVVGVMGHYLLSAGQDELGHYLSYYDKWDLNIGPERQGGFLGKPFEIYDRLYYDPRTFEPIPNLLER